MSGIPEQAVPGERGSGVGRGRVWGRFQGRGGEEGVGGQGRVDAKI